MRVELGAIEFSAEFRDGQLVYGSPRIEILQDSMQEVQSHVPDGKYKWVLVLGLDKAEKIESLLTIQDVIDRGWIACNKCSAQRRVGSEGNDRGMVAPCATCGDSGYWNLFVSTA
jgi:hypothetical protein